jgi:hypothetical protein
MSRYICGQRLPEDKYSLLLDRKLDRNLQRCVRHGGHKGSHRSKEREWQQLAKFSLPRRPYERGTE